MRNVRSAMNATSATLLFAAGFAATGLLAGVYVGSVAIGLFHLALTLPVGAFTFWFGARRVRHEWYSVLISGVVAFAVTSAMLPELSLVLSPWWLLFAINVAMAALGFFLGFLPRVHSAFSKGPK